MLNLATSQTSTEQLPDSWIEKLFHRMLLSYGKKFTDQWGGADGDELIAHWGLELAGYTGAEIKRGLDALANKEWPPTLPEFKKLCRSPLDPVKAYYEAVAGIAARAAGEYGKWSHPAVYWTAMPMSFDLGNMSVSQMKPRWESALDAQMAIGEWAEIPQPMLALVAPGKSVPNPAQAAQLLRKLRDEVVSPRSDGRDPKRWAERILERAARGDKELLAIQIQFASEAVGIKSREWGAA
jgi:hypothetical protein